MKKEIFFILLAQFSSSIFANESPNLTQKKQEISHVEHIHTQSLKEILSHAKRGDYIVAESGKMLTLISIQSITSKSILIEEISAPLKNIKADITSWQNWVKNKAPGASSWSVLEMDLENGQILDCYSFTRNAHVQISQKESLLATLFQLPLKTVQSEKRRRIGPTPMPGEGDFRKLWLPSLVIEGKKIQNPQFNVYETTWPNDQSELDGRQVTLYFDQEMRIPLPVWIDIETSHVNGRIQVIDSGKNLISPQRSIPRRFPQFMNDIKKTDEGVVLSLMSPKYFRDFALFAIDISDKEKEILPIPSISTERNGEIVTIKINQRDLTSLQEKHRYQWLIVPIGFDESYSATSKTFIY